MAQAILTATIQDAKTLSTARVRNQHSVAIQMALGSMTLANLTDYWTQFTIKLNALTEGQIIGGGVTIVPALDGTLRTSPIAGSDVQEGAILAFSLTGSSYVESVRVPAFNQTLFGADGVSVNVADAAVIAMETLLTGANGSYPFTATNRYAQEFAALLSGRKSFRK